MLSVVAGSRRAFQKDEEKRRQLQQEGEVTDSDIEHPMRESQAAEYLGAEQVSNLDQGLHDVEDRCDKLL